MKNTLTDLNNHLFSMLELLDDDDAMADEKTLANSLNRAKAMSAVASQILGVARVQLEAIRTADSCGGLKNSELPELVAIKPRRDKLLDGGGRKN